MTEHEAFTALVRRAHAAVYRSAYRVLRSRSDAEDVTQEAFLRAWRRGPQHARTLTPAALQGTALQLALNRRRAAQRRKRHEEEGATRRPEAMCDESVVRSESTAIVRRELDALPDDLRLALVLRYQEELGLETAARLLGCAVSTVHQRLEHGLARLRGRLRDAGLAGAAPLLLEEEVALAGEVDVPAGLETQLLALASSTPVAGTAAALAKLATFVGAAAIVGVLVPRLFDLRGAPQDPAPGPAVPAVAQGEPESAPPPAVRTLVPPPAAPGEPAQDPTATELPSGTLRGVVRDANGTPLAGALVVANSVAYWGKVPVHSRQARSAQDGRFELEVPVPEQDGYRYTLWARCEGHRPAHREALLVERGRVHAGQDFALARPGEPAGEGHWSLAVTVVDAQGRPRAGAQVRVRTGHAVEDPLVYREQEAFARTDAQGTATLRGQTLGAKTVEVDARGAGGVFESRALTFERSGEERLRFVSPDGLEVHGTLRGPSGEALPIYLLQVWQPGLDNGSAAWTTKRDGSFVLRGLRPGAVTVSAQQQEAWFPPGPQQMQEGADAPEPDAPPLYSPFTTTVTAGARELVLRVKRLDDPRAFGLHDAELHGRVVDERGEGVVCGPFELEAIRIPDDVRDAAQWRLDWLAEQVHTRPVQVAMSGPSLPPAPDFHLGGLRPGRYLVCFTKYDFAPAASQLLWIGPRQVFAGLTLRVERGATLEGRVVDAGGRGVAGALLLVTGEGEAGRRKARDLAGALREARDERVTLPVDCVRSDAEGRFRIEHLPAQVPLLVHAMHEKQGGAQSPRLVLPSGALTLTLR